MFRGLTQVVLGGQSLAPFPTSFQKFQQAIYLILSAAIIFISLSMIIGVGITALLIFGQWRTPGTPQEKFV